MAPGWELLRFDAPLWALAVPFIVLSGWLWPALGVFRPWRLAAWLLAVLALSKPRILERSGDLDLWVLLDCSDSAAAETAAGREEWLALLAKAPGRRPGDRIRLLEFAGDIRVTEPGDPGRFEGSATETRLRLAIEHALSAADPSRAARLLVFTDGQPTDSLESVEALLKRRRVPLDLRLLPGPPPDDWSVTSLRLPPRAGEKEFVVAEITAAGPSGASREFEVFRNGQRIGSGVLTARRGEARASLLLPPPGPGAARYEVRLSVSGDPRPKNNQAVSWVAGGGGASVLLVSPWADDPVAAALSSAGVAVRHQRDPAALGPGDLAGACAVLIHGFGAGRLNPEFLRGLDFHVRQLGRGLAMFGGRESFGSGGYFESALDPLLPVSMELKKEHRKLALSMAILLDRSGSMAMTTADGSVKMHLANRGAARAIDLLGPSDAVAVFAVDSAAHRVFPLRQIGSQSARIQGLVRRIESGGGGIFVYEALSAGWREIKDAPGRKHLLLFSDAADSEEPGDYIRLLAEMRAANATVSVIGLGTERDPDAELLKDIAARGGGRIFFTNDAAELPSLFAQETVAVARSTFLEEPAPAAPRGGWAEISQAALEWPAAVDGYNLCYTRPGASVSLESRDEYNAPLVAHWRRGLGRVAAVTFPLAGGFSDSARSWPSLQRFCSALVAWLAGSAQPPGAAVRLRADGGELLVEFSHDDTWFARAAAAPPRLVYQSSSAPGASERAWDFAEPGRFEARIPFGAAEWVRGAVVVGEEAIDFGPVSPGVNPEWSGNPSARARLRDLSAASGGRLLDDLGTVWQAPREPGCRALGPPLLAAFLAVWLAGALVERAGWRLRMPFARPPAARPGAEAAHAAARNAPRPRGQASAMPQPRPRERRRGSASPKEPTASAETAPAPPEAAARRREIFAKAKRRL